MKGRRDKRKLNVKKSKRMEKNRVKKTKGKIEIGMEKKDRTKGKE